VKRQKDLQLSALNFKLHTLLKEAVRRKAWVNRSVEQGTTLNKGSIINSALKFGNSKAQLGLKSPDLGYIA